MRLLSSDRRCLLHVAFAAMLISLWGSLQNVQAQQGFERPATENSASARGEPALETETDSAAILAELTSAEQTQQSKSKSGPAGIDFFSLLLKGGWFMIPIGLVSVLAVTFIFERAFALRGGKLLPRGLVRKLSLLAKEGDSIDPRVAYAACLKHPSATSAIVRAMLARVGRPHSELTAAVAEVSQREADRAYAGVRWLNFAAGVAPLLGLLGTVWGLIQAFHDMTQLGPSQNRAEYLGRGIYEALVTTLAGLIVAIPAALFAQFFEGRITRYFQRIEEIVFNLMPKFERYEGKTRFEAIGRELVSRPIDSGRKPNPTQPMAVPTQTSAPHAAANLDVQKTGEMGKIPSAVPQKSVQKST